MTETRTVKDIIAEAVGCPNDVESARAANRVMLDLANAGFKILPREPTIEMRKACTFEAAERDYPAMWDAAP